MEEGYIEKATGSSTYTAHYYLNDRLGNHRIVIDASGTLKQVNNFYPSGTSKADYPRRSDQAVHPHKFGGKKLDRSNGLDFYDFEARAYNPVLMRFTSIDPMAKNYPGISPYAYCANNPVNRIDMDGREVYYAQDGTRLGKIGDNDDIRVINATLSSNDALSHISSVSEDAVSALMGNSVAFDDYFTSVSDVTNGAISGGVTNRGLVKNYWISEVRNSWKIR